MSIKRITREQLADLQADIRRGESSPDNKCPWCDEPLDNGQPLARNGMLHERCFEVVCSCMRTLD